MEEHPSSQAPGDDIAALVQRSKNGDWNAFGELVRLYSERVYGLAYSFLKTHHDAEDVSQEAFLKAFKKMKSLKTTGSFESWILTIAANLSKNKLRWRNLRRKLTFSLDAPGPEGDAESSAPLAVMDADPSSDPAHAADRLWLRRRILQGLDSLSAQQRTAIHLKFEQGYTIAETARIMGLSEGTVKAHIHRGLTGLRKMIGEKIE